jgi:hypothetical protein
MGVPITDRPQSELEDGLLRGSDLLAIAQRFEPETSTRTLEYWRQEHLLPRPERGEQDGIRPTWWYPSATRAQLEELLRLRQRTVEPDDLRIALWFKGYDVPTAQARASSMGFLKGLVAEFE